jgi:hypothetical protein
MTAPTLFRLVTLAEAKDHLAILDSADDRRIDRLVFDASQLVMDYIGTNSLALGGWCDTSGKPLVDDNGDPLRVGALGHLNTAGDFVLDLDTNGDPINIGVSVIPGPVRAATLLVIGNMDAKRGEDDGANPISAGVESLLARYRLPVLA